MQLLRNLSVLVIFGILLIAPGVSAGEGHSGRARKAVSERDCTIGGHLFAFVKAIWVNGGWGTEPFSNAPGEEEDSGDNLEDPGTDEGFQIDPWG